MSEDRSRLDELRIERPDEPLGRRSGRPLGWSIVALLAVAAGLGWWLLRPRPVAVRTAAVESVAAGAALSVLDASGYVVARRQATVSSKVTGKILEVFVEEGMAVEEGQVLARLDDALAGRELALAEARSTAARSAAREIEVRLREARLDQQRTRELAAAGVSSQSQLDMADAEADSLAARLEAARDDVEVVARQAALRRQEVEDTIIRAPFAGVAISKNAQPGEMISPVSAGGGFTRTGVSTIVDMASLEIEVDVNEAYIGRVRPDQPVTARLDAYPDWEIPARVITTIPAADRQKATFRVRIGFEELGDPRILPDMGVKVSFRAEPAAPDAAAPTLRIPSAALRRDGEVDTVLVVRDGAVERRAVAVGARSGDTAEILSGVRIGERVVVDPPTELEDGAPVRVDDGR